MLHARLELGARTEAVDDGWHAEDHADELENDHGPDEDVEETQGDRPLLLAVGICDTISVAKLLNLGHQVKVKDEDQNHYDAVGDGGDAVENDAGHELAADVLWHRATVASAADNEGRGNDGEKSCDATIGIDEEAE
eukprot:CAMPEP_0185162144 /NCGR_PEP_ID=MMETSP1139-20130426/6033_1 /TAXON_ID=298111 /ORGANISM="Pavlova sp., Strain CCMP459" /LENGTH=136 /DNA_ID=CAMNT_0027727455 /DNA_START=214 /DNA_END=624 /DNA_ORIENTATION=-